MTTTTRRPPKTAKKIATYVMIHLQYVAASTDIIACTANKEMIITGTNGASVEIKAGEQFFLHRAASSWANMFYIVRQVVGHKRCSCPAHKPCKHEIAIAARVARSQVVTALPAAKEVAALIALAASIPGGASSRRDRATASLQTRSFPGLPPTWQELAKRKQSA